MKKEIKTPTIKQMKKILSSETRATVKTYLLARAYAETMREAVDKIANQVLKEYPAYVSKKFVKLGEPQRRILKHENFYLCEDKTYKKLYKEMEKREREAKLKPVEMPFDYCPALVAEDLQRQAENALIDVSGEPIDLNHTDILSHELRQQYIDLIVRAVVNLPDFETDGKKLLKGVLCEK